MSEFPADWPGPGPIDLTVHDLPHASSTTEWWYINCHLETSSGRKLSLFASFFRIVHNYNEATKQPEYAHSVTWAIVDPHTATYYNESLLDQDAPKIGLKRIDMGDSAKERDPHLTRALREVLAHGNVPQPDRLFKRPPTVDLKRLDLDFDGNTFRRLDDGRYELKVRHQSQAVGYEVILEPLIPACRHGEDGVIRGISGEDMYYAFIPRCNLTGKVLLPTGEEDIVSGTAWYDHQFGKPLREKTESEKQGRVGWNWCGIQLADGTAVSAYILLDDETQLPRSSLAVIVDPNGKQRSYSDMEFDSQKEWTSTRTFHTYPIEWTLKVPAAKLSLTLKAPFPDQEFVTLISKPAFWEGRVDVSGKFKGRNVTGLGFIERTGMNTIMSLDGFFSAVGREVRHSLETVLPRRPNWEQTRDFVASKERSHYMDGVDIEQLARTMVDPVRDITDRGGKSWRSYAALACCDVVGGDSREFVQWLSMPELIHVGSLIVDDVQDKSTIRRGGPCTHLVYGEALAINAGTACYFMGQRLLFSGRVNSRDRLRLYDLYFECLRAGHAGQALDLDGHDRYMPSIVESGDSNSLEQRVLAVHRLKTAVPASSLARMGALVGGGTEAQIEGVGHFFESLGLAFQIVDDVLNLRGFKGDLKSRGEDIAQGKVTLPIAKAMGRLPLNDRRKLWKTVSSKPQDPKVIAKTIAQIEKCGALDACVEDSRNLIESAWKVLDPLVDDSMSKMMLRAFGWFVLERHY